MKSFFQIAAAAMVLFLLDLPGTAPAQSTVFTYQGRVTDNGTNFNGGGLFKFALVTGSNANFTTFWSNDGTSVNGSEPTAAVPVGVSNGIFTVVLGDATQSNMTSMNASVFNQPNLRLRIWFNDGVSGSLALDPPQNLTPAPYAIFANTASNLVNGFTVLPTTNDSRNVLGGSSGNFIFHSVIGATISGGGATNLDGFPFTNAVYGNFGTVSGGGANTASANFATVSGGEFNTASDDDATVGGGSGNTANRFGSTVSGGEGNRATNFLATVPGGLDNTAGGIGSFAAGQHAEAVHDGSFVWSDNELTVFSSTTTNQFSVRATGGVRIFDGGAGVAIGSSGQYFAAGGPEKLRIIRGVVDASANTLHGTNFSVVRTAVGAYTITFSPGFSDFPVVTVSAQSGLARMATITNVGDGSAQVRIFDATGAAADTQFHFIAIGPQ